MSNPTNWPIVTDADAYFRHNEKRLLHEQRRPIVGHGNIVGAGISPEANEVDDWDDDVCATNGYFRSAQGIPNAPASYSFNPEGYYWLGHVVSGGTEGYQRLQLMGVNYDEDEPPYPDIVATRQWRTSKGVRHYSAWRGEANRPVTRNEISYVGTGGSEYIPGFQFDEDGPFGSMYCPGSSTVWYVHIAITVSNTSDTLRSARFWPSINGGLSIPEHGDYGYWQHDGPGDPGHATTQTASRSWFITPPAGSNTLGFGILATTGLAVDELDLYAFQVQ
jgi:hypothetical protein